MIFDSGLGTLCPEVERNDRGEDRQEFLATNGTSGRQAAKYPCQCNGDDGLHCHKLVQSFLH